jgi:hypothetical protein
MSESPGGMPHTDESKAIQGGQRQIRVHVDEAAVADVFANAFRTDASGEEIFLNFGINRLLPGAEEQGPQVLFKPSVRVIMTYYTAKRLAIMLGQLLRDHEGQFGEIELDIDKRRVGPPPRAGVSQPPRPINPPGAAQPFVRPVDGGDGPQG